MKALPFMQRQDVIGTEVYKMNKMIVIGIISILQIIVVGMALVLLMATVQAIEQQPYIICGHVYNESAVLASSVEVILLNIRTEESQTFVTNEVGEYLFECLNFKQGYKNKDVLNIICVYGSQEIIIDIQNVGVQCPINKPAGVPIEPIVAGTVLVSVLGGAYYYIKRKGKQKEVLEEKMSGEIKEEEEKKENPLWLPEGSIRAILAIAGFTGVVVCVVMGVEVPEYLRTIVGMMVAFFFGGHTPIKK